RLRRQPERGQVIDVAIYEAVFNLLESTVPEYDRFGVVRQPSGATITGVVPSNLYPTADGKQVIIGANSDPMFRRLMRALGRPDLAEDPRLAVNAGRVEHQAEVDEAIASWTRGRSVAEALAVLEQAGVAAGSLYDVADMFRDPHFQERGLFETVETPEGPLKVPALAPKLSATPGATEWGGSELGAHTEEVLRELVGLSAEEIERLRGEGVI
ncbi:MAG TPA: CaiB/BaiF CoA-transferase family protein, partial [Thermoanaerobaculia bacterium]|nr:CaiB/BaiF CoA-transferase family protein [Thermoanaerobaculia bacterium]